MEPRKYNLDEFLETYWEEFSVFSALEDAGESIFDGQEGPPLRQATLQRIKLIPRNVGTREPVTLPEGCLDLETVQLYGGNETRVETSTNIYGHLVECVPCREQIYFFVRHFGDKPREDAA